LKLWEFSTVNLIWNLEGHGCSVNSAFSPNGETLATGSKDNTAKLWEVSTGKLIKTFKGHSGSVNALAFTPDGETLATGSDDTTAKLWEVKTAPTLPKGEAKNVGLMDTSTPILARQYISLNLSELRQVAPITTGDNGYRLKHWLKQRVTHPQYVLANLPVNWFSREESSKAQEPEKATAIKAAPTLPKGDPISFRMGSLPAGAQIQVGGATFSLPTTSRDLPAGTYATSIQFPSGTEFTCTITASDGKTLLFREKNQVCP
jgi:hypothetical protein